MENNSDAAHLACVLNHYSLQHQLHYEKNIKGSGVVEYSKSEESQ